MAGSGICYPSPSPRLEFLRDEKMMGGKLPREILAFGFLMCVRFRQIAAQRK